LPSADPEARLSFSASAAEDDFLNYAFNADADGYPVPPLQAVAYQSSIEGWSAGFLFSYYDTVDVTGDFGSHPPPPPPVPATLSIGDVSVAEGDRGSAKLTLRVALASASDQTVTVDYRTVDGTAVSGGKARKGDYGAASGTLTFLAGETSKTIVISIRSDNFVEADETFTVQLLNAVGAPVTDGVATVTIRNDD
jgi:hypothetical protein